MEVALKLIETVLLPVFQVVASYEFYIKFNISKFAIDIGIAS